MFLSFSLLHCWSWKLALPPPFPPWFLHLFEGKERGDLDLHFHQSLSPLSEGNLLDLDLASSLWISSFVLPLISLHSISCFGRIWVRRTWALVFLPLHRFEFSSEIRWWKFVELITLGFLEP
jgi:hypothetical protein